jgi:AraC-like DNA-binding protein
MSFHDLDATVRIAGVFLLLVLGLLLARDARSRRLAGWFAAFALCLAGFLIGNTADPSLRLSGPIAVGAHVVSGYLVVCLWWFALSCFDRSFRPQGAVLASGLAWLILASADRGFLGAWSADRLSRPLVALGFGMIAYLVWRLVHDRAGDLLERRRSLRVTVVVLLAGLLFVERGKEALFGPAWRPEPYVVIQNTAILGFILWLMSQLLRADTRLLTSGPAAQSLASAPALAAGETRLAARLRVLMEVERIHLDPDLTFGAFVRRMAAPERSVRRLINHQLGHDHFRAFLNAYRMAEARRLLADPGRADDKLVAIAMDAGFASIASFNRVFRATEGCSPSEFRRRGASEDLAADPQPAFEKPLAAF